MLVKGFVWCTLLVVGDHVGASLVEIQDRFDVDMLARPAPHSPCRPRVCKQWVDWDINRCHWTSMCCYLLDSLLQAICTVVVDTVSCHGCMACHRTMAWRRRWSPVQGLYQGLISILCRAAPARRSAPDRPGEMCEREWTNVHSDNTVLQVRLHYRSPGRVGDIPGKFAVFIAVGSWTLGCARVHLDPFCRWMIRHSVALTSMILRYPNLVKRRYHNTDKSK